MPLPLISIVIINFNTSDLTKNCIVSLLQHERGKSIEIIVVDNASRAEDCNKLEAVLVEFPDVKCIWSKTNLGFSAGNMFGFQHARGRYLMFVNSDVVWIEPILDRAIAFLQDTPDAGLCGFQILDEHRKESISFRVFEGFRYKILGKKFLRWTQPERPYIGKRFTAPAEVDFVIGSCLLFDAKAFKQINGFDQNLFLYYEETDVCQRLAKRGYTTWFLPELRYIHLEGKSSGANPLLKIEHLISFFYVTAKNSGVIKSELLWFWLVLSFGLKAPFKAKNRFIFKRLFLRRHTLAHSMRHLQTIH